MAAGDIADALRAMTIEELKSIDGVIRAANTRLDYHYSSRPDTTGHPGWEMKPIGGGRQLHVMKSLDWEAQVEPNYKVGFDVDVFSLTPAGPSRGRHLQGPEAQGPP